MRLRVPQLLVGLVMCGVGIALMVDAGLGLAPWEVLHQGIHERTDIAIGTVSILLGVPIFLLWIPLRQRIGVGTVCNVLLIGNTTNFVLRWDFDPKGLPARVALCVLGDLLIGLGGGVYIGARFGTGPRDGLMTGLVARGYPLRSVRTFLEVTVLVIGWLLGGTVGFGTILFALTAGPLVHFALDRLDHDAAELTEDVFPPPAVS